jgi:hypothetical protein
MGVGDVWNRLPRREGELQSDRPAKDGCPPADRDDTVLDVDDACPTLAEPASIDATKNGCPKDAPTTRQRVRSQSGRIAPAGASRARIEEQLRHGDRDADGILDAADACPDVARTESTDASVNGCPDDPDGDGIKGPRTRAPTKGRRRSGSRLGANAPSSCASTGIKIAARADQFKISRRNRGRGPSLRSSDLEIHGGVAQHRIPQDRGAETTPTTAARTATT